MAEAPGFTRVYRAVSAEEYQQILRTGRFEVIAAGCEGKHFADALDGARRFGEAVLGTGNYRLVVADVPDAAPSLFRWPNLDGFGPARFVQIDDLKNVRPRPCEGEV